MTKSNSPDKEKNEALAIRGNLRRFVIAVDGLTESEERLLANYLKPHGDWWHWIPNLWLFVTTNREINAYAIMTQIGEISRHPGIVFEFDEDLDCAALLPPDKKTSSNPAGEWIARKWKGGNEAWLSTRTPFPRNNK